MGYSRMHVIRRRRRHMAKPTTVRKYDPVVRKHVEYKEGKIK
jgi:large subunit ribosomal protein L33